MKARQKRVWKYNSSFISWEWAIELKQVSCGWILPCVSVVNGKNIKFSGIFYYIELRIALFADHFSIKRLETRSKITVLGSKYSKIYQLYQSEDFEYFDPNAVIFWSSSKDFFTKMINKKSPTKFDRQKRLLILHRKAFLANLENQHIYQRKMFYRKFIIMILVEVWSNTIER
jgi:hypothetical protein